MLDMDVSASGQDGNQMGKRAMGLSGGKKKDDAGGARVREGETYPELTTSSGCKGSCSAA